MIVHIVASLRRLSLALSLGLPLGFVVGVLSSWRGTRHIMSTGLSVMLPIPGMALIPVAIVLFGFNDPPIVTVSAICAFAPLAHSVMAGLDALPIEVLEAAAMDGCGWLSSLVHIQVPMIRESIIVGIRLGIVKCWRTVIATEFVAAASAGLGYSVQDAAEYLRFDLILVGIILVSIIGYCLNGFVATFGK